MHNEDSKIDWVAMEEVALKNIMNFGPAQDMWHPEYGWILLDGKVTDAGRTLLMEHAMAAEINSGESGESNDE